MCPLYVCSSMLSCQRNSEAFIPNTRSVRRQRNIGRRPAAQAKFL